MLRKIEKKIVSGYSIENISIIYTFFNRSEKYNKNDKLKNDIALSVNKIVSKNSAKCTLGVEYTSINDNGETIISANISILGIFKKAQKEVSISIDNFARLNALVIMYPFLREHLANLSLKAGIDIIMLPSVNFKALMEDKVKE